MKVLLGYYHISKYPLLGDMLEHAGSLKSCTQGYQDKSRDHSLVNINVHFVAAALSLESPAKSIHHHYHSFISDDSQDKDNVASQNC